MQRVVFRASSHAHIGRTPSTKSQVRTFVYSYRDSIEITLRSVTLGSRYSLFLLSPHIGPRTPFFAKSWFFDRYQNSQRWLRSFTANPPCPMRLCRSILVSVRRDNSTLTKNICDVGQRHPQEPHANTSSPAEQ